MQLAAMALSPLAALSLPFIQDEKWVESMKEAALRLREKATNTTDSQGFQNWLLGLDDKLTFMDWTYRLTGVDLTYVWDAELWVKFKEAVSYDMPHVFWNELADRIDYSESPHPLSPPLIANHHLHTIRGSDPSGRHCWRHETQLCKVHPAPRVQQS